MPGPFGPAYSKRAIEAAAAPPKLRCYTWRCPDPECNVRWRGAEEERICWACGTLGVTIPTKVTHFMQ